MYTIGNNVVIREKIAFMMQQRGTYDSIRDFKKNRRKVKSTTGEIFNGKLQMVEKWKFRL